MKISVIIITYNRANILKNTLECLARQTIKPFEVIVVDNFSTDKTKDVIYDFGKKLPIKYVSEKRNNLAVLRNLGIKLSKGKIIAFLDDDTRVSREWIYNLKNYFNGNRTVDCVCGYLGVIKKDYLTEANRNITESIFVMANKFANSIGMLSKLKAFLKTQIKDFFHSQVNFTGTTTMAMKRDVFEKIGLFDENFAHVEEFDFQLRMLKNNIKMVLLPFRIDHYYKNTLSGIVKQYFSYGFYEYLSYVKHRRDKNLRRFMTNIEKSFLVAAFFPFLVTMRYLILNKKDMKLELIPIIFFATLIARFCFALGTIYSHYKIS